jgi:hypothetical protein
MDSCGQKPFFCVVLRDGDRWLVEAEWPDGTIVEVDSFKAHLDALNWVKTQSQAWLQGRGDATSDDYRVRRIAYAYTRFGAQESNDAPTSLTEWFTA